jgi:hypothetical protein
MFNSSNDDPASDFAAPTDQNLTEQCRSARAGRPAPIQSPQSPGNSDDDASGDLDQDGGEQTQESVKPVPQPKAEANPSESSTENFPTDFGQAIRLLTELQSQPVPTNPHAERAHLDRLHNLGMHVKKLQQGSPIIEKATWEQHVIDRRRVTEGPAKRAEQLAALRRLKKF